MAIKSQTEKLWTKYFTITFISAMFTSTSNGMLMTGIPLYALYIGGDNTISGLLFGLFMLVAILFRPFFGKLIDEKTRIIVLIIGSMITVFLSVTFIFAYSIGLLLIIRSMQGIGFSATTNALGTIVADIVPKSRLAEGVGYFGLSNTISMAIGPSLSLFLINQFSYNVYFIAVVLIGLVGLVSSFLIDYEKKIKDIGVVSQPPPSRKLSEMIFEKTTIPSSLVMFFIFIGMGAIITFVPIYALSLGIDDIGIYFTVYSIALLVTRIGGGKISDKYGAAKVILPGMLIIIFSYIVLAYSTSLPAFIVAGILYGIGHGSVDPTLNAIMVKFCPTNRRGAGNSTLFTAKDVGSGMGAVVWGIISINAGFRTVFLLCALCIVLGLVSYFFILRKQIQKGKLADKVPQTV
ncbi:MAG TPA: MFS transporter [Metabacillus sp.]|nr:MFS transporter [Metabacillus sp.]